MERRHRGIVVFGAVSNWGLRGSALLHCQRTLRTMPIKEEGYPSTELPSFDDALQLLCSDLALLCSIPRLELTRLSQVVPAPVAVIDHGYDHPEEGAVWGRDPVRRIG
jgi:hypothetical protein